MGKNFRKPWKNELSLNELEKGKHHFWLEATADRSGGNMGIPVSIVKGAPGRTIGVIAATHGDELNGISVIHQLFKKLNPDEMTGCFVGIPVLNMPGFLRNQREFFDDRDLNRLMNGYEAKSPAGQYVKKIKNKLFSHFDCLIDLHTATSGRVNTYHIRVNSNHEESSKMAHLMGSDIIVHSPKADGTSRYFFEKNGKPAITVEIGNPQILQDILIDQTIEGVIRNLEEFNVLPKRNSLFEDKATICCDSVWVFARSGGLLEVFPKLGDIIQKGSQIAIQTDLFGEVIEKYKAPISGIVIGRKNTASSQTGDRLIHIGVIKDY